MKVPVKAIMTGSPRTIEADASALAALDLMIDHGIRHLPVTGAGGGLVGVLSMDDLRAAFPWPVSLCQPPDPAQRDAARDLLVAEIMTHAPEVIGSDGALEDAAIRMAQRRIGCLPVVDAQGRLEGILSETDVLYAVASALWSDRVRRRTSPEAQAEAFVESLRAEHDRLLGSLSSYEAHERELTEQHREIPLDLAEDGADATDANLTARLAAATSRRLQALEHALERADKGQLGRCERCEGEITLARLRALPGTALCIRCARTEEAGTR